MMTSKGHVKERWLQTILNIRYQINR